MRSIGNPDCPDCTYDSKCLDCQAEEGEARYQQHLASLWSKGQVPCSQCVRNGTNPDQDLCQECLSAEPALAADSHAEVG